MLALNISSLQRFGLVFGIGAVIWALLLRFYIPGYFDPFVPYHLDHYIYLGNSAEPYGLSRYIMHYPRPLGNALFDLLGRLGIRGMLVPVFLLVLANICLLLLYVERVVDRRTSLLTIAVFFLLVFGNPESYTSTKEDILASVCFFCLLLIFHLWQNYLLSGKVLNLVSIVTLALLASYVKETYFAATVVFFVVQAAVYRKESRTAMLLALVSSAIAAGSLAYNAHIAIFVNTHAGKTDAYYQNLSIKSLLHGYRVLLKWLLLPVPTVLVFAALIALAARLRQSCYIGLSSLLLAATVLLPHSILPNHLEDQYSWLAAGFFFVPVLLADQLLPVTRPKRAVAALAAILVCAWTLKEYRKDLSGRLGWSRQQERYSRNLLKQWPLINSSTHDGEKELVVGICTTFNPFFAGSFILRSFGPRTKWTVVVPDSTPRARAYTTELIHRADMKPEAYDHVFVFSPDARLTAIYSRDAVNSIISDGKWPTLVPSGDYKNVD